MHYLNVHSTSPLSGVEEDIKNHALPQRLEDAKNIANGAISLNTSLAPKAKVMLSFVTDIAPKKIQEARSSFFGGGSIVQAVSVVLESMFKPFRNLPDQNLQVLSEVGQGRMSLEDAKKQLPQSVFDSAGPKPPPSAFPTTLVVGGVVGVGLVLFLLARRRRRQAAGQLP